MQGTSPRTLTNKELIQYASDKLHDEGTLAHAEALELLRRLNYYTEGRENQNATIKDTRQLELPLQ